MIAPRSPSSAVILDGLTAGTSDLQSAGLVSAEALDAITADVNNLESQLFTPVDSCTQA